MLHREKEILESECEMCVIHGLLSKIPDDLPLETLITKAYNLYQRYSPDELAHEAILNFKRQQRSVFSWKTGKIISPFTLFPLVATCCLLITFANSLDPDQARQNVWLDLDPN